MNATEGPGDDEALAHTETVAAEESAVAKDAEDAALHRGAALGRYLVVAEIGSGAMGIVYSAFDPDLDRKVAIKVLRKTRDPAARARLLREAQAMAKLSHPNVVTVFEVATEGGRDFVSMEFVDGQTLNDWQEEEHEAPEILRVYQQAGEGLAAAHRAGLVHRDFKPHNVLIDKEGRVRVTDFGIAQHMAEPVMVNADTLNPDDAALTAKGNHNLTRTGAVMGTPAYMAPEQHLATETDSRTDQFSFCVALYQALAGRRPFEAETYPELKALVTEGPVPTLPESVSVPSSLRSALAKGMSHKRADRHGSMDELLPLLELEPSRGHTLLFVGLIAAALIAVFVFGMNSSRDESACIADRSQLEGVWDDEVRGKMRTAFAMTHVDGAEAVFGKFESIADQYADDIVAMRLDICEAGRRQKSVKDKMILRRMTCLLGRQQKFLHLTSSFSNPNRSGVNQIVESAESLPQVVDCADVDALERDVGLPPPNQREEVEALQASLSEASSQGEAGHVKDAIKQTEAVALRAKELDYKPLLAEVYVELGTLYTREDRVREAERAFEDAIVAAEESGYTEYRARALVGVTSLVASGSSRFHEARSYARRAKAAIAQWGDEPHLSADIDAALAHVLMQEGHAPEAYKLLVSTLAIYSNYKDARPVRMAELQNSVASLLVELGRYDEAHQMAQRSYALVRAELAESNPKLYGPLMTLATTHRMHGEFEEARRLDLVNRKFWEGEGAEALLKESDDYEHKSRSIRGQVQDDKGAPVAGATVVCGPKIVADGRYLDASWNPSRDSLQRRRVTQSLTDGSFHCAEASKKAVVVVADHGTIGRSMMTKVAAGSEVDGISLVLRATGVLTGKVTKNGQPVKAQSVSAVPAAHILNNPPHAAVAFLKPDGSYRFDRLAPGSYVVFTGPRSMDHSLAIKSQEVLVESNRDANLDFDQSGGDATLVISVVGEGGTPMPSAQVLLAPGHAESANAKDFNEAVIAAGIDIRADFVLAKEWVTLEGLEAGLYSVCAVPIGGDHRDPEHMKQFSEKTMDRVMVYCQDVTVAPGETKSVEAAVPAWKPIIAIEKPPTDSE